MSDGSCPKCGAPLNPVEIGQFHDKFLKCSHCGYQVDVQDEIEIEESEEGRTESGTYRTVKRVIRRIDAAEDGLTDRDISPEQMESAVDQVRALMGDEMAQQVADVLEQAGDLRASGAAPGKVITMTTVSSNQEPIKYVDLPRGNSRPTNFVPIIGGVVAIGACLLAMLVLWTNTP